MHLDLERFGGAKDQRAEFLSAFGPFHDEVKVLRNRILIGTYVERIITAGGVHLPPKRIQESRFQGKVGLVLKLGDRAFKWRDDSDEIDPQAPQIGDWVFYRASDTWEVGVGPGIPCRIVYDDNVQGIIKDPSKMW